MSDPSELIESQHFNPEWARRNDQEYARTVEWMTRFGVDGKDRLERTGFMPSYATAGLKRVPPSLNRLNLHKSRYHLPGGNRYGNTSGIYDINNSSAKPSQGYNDLVIEQNNTYWGHGY